MNLGMFYINNSLRYITRDELVQLIAESEYEMLDQGDIIEVLINGCGGWGKLEDKELIETGLELELIHEEEFFV
ncbi:MAG: hypothetical protein ACW96U_00815 [Candidatus Heimdallarchaeaceae archaeon]|jgi:N-methylhydantoinase B/oxoprolinase/acetone carboxylase alpha subunit